jgi:hypothetical protein
VVYTNLQGAKAALLLNLKHLIMKKMDLQLVIEYAIIFAVLVLLAAIKVFTSNG